MAAPFRAWVKTLTGWASKVTFDALRREVRQGQVQRLGRGRYRDTTTARSTAGRIGLLAATAQHWIVARTRNETPPPAGRPAWYNLSRLRTR